MTPYRSIFLIAVLLAASRVLAGPLDATLENPRAGSVQSGIGLLSGWACSSDVAVVVDGTAYRPAWGTPRADAAAQCGGNANVGFGLLVNFNLLGNGSHTAQLRIGATSVGAPVTFTVATLGREFATGLAGQYLLDDFPQAGMNATLVWQEGLQNFAVAAAGPGIQGAAASAPAPSGSSRAKLENPTGGSYLSGIGLLSGWSCSGGVAVVIDGVAYTPSYGTPRSDAAPACFGNANVGFGMLVNFNLLGPGLHSAQLRVGTALVGTPVLFNVATLGREYYTGLAGRYVLADFPQAGTSTTLLWQEAQQNFALAGTTSGLAGGAPLLQPALAVPILGSGANAVAGRVVAEGSGLNFSLAAAPSVGSVTLDSLTGAFTYSVPSPGQASGDRFAVNVAGNGSFARATVPVVFAGDPLFVNQWYLSNTGAHAFSSTPPVAGNDINVLPAWLQGYTGRGIKVAVVDSGLEATHEDLAANLDLSNSHNYVNGTTDPSPDPDDIGSDHGTMVAGIVGAVAFNNRGGRGVAYGARLRGYNLLQNFTLTNFTAAMGGQFYSADNDIFNTSFAKSPAMLPPYSAFARVNAQFGPLRGGRGAILVISAGNEFDDTGDDEADPQLCAEANRLQVSCGNPANDERRGGTVPLLVGATSAKGLRASYSTTGASLWVAAPGGEFGNDVAYLPGRSALSYEPAIVTTARTGCQHGERGNALDAQGAHPLAKHCQYTAKMNGTSSAAPIVAGIVALMLEANPNLGDRDVKYILARTARQIDPAQAAVSHTVNGVSKTIEQGWVRNAAGYAFSNWYGFGAVDAAAAVAMARSYTAYLPAQQTAELSWTPASPVTVPANSPSGHSIDFAVTATFSTLEQVVLFFDMSSTPWLRCNQIELTSPAGTRSILMHYGTGFDQRAVTNSRMLTNAFYGEPVAGNWTLTFYDFCPASARATVLTGVPALIFAGH